MGASVNREIILIASALILCLGVFAGWGLESAMRWCGRRAARSELPGEFLSRNAVRWLAGSLFLALAIVTASTAVAYAILYTLAGGTS